MPEYEHICEACNYEWEDTYSIHKDPPKTCPKCKKRKAKRLISGSGSVKVELHGRELVNKLWKEGKEMAKKAKTDEKVAADLYGEK